MRQTLNSHLRALEFFSAEQAQVDSQIHAQSITCGQQQCIKRLKTACGVGNVTAATFAAELFHSTRLRRGEEFVSYLGLAPVVRESGDKKDRGRLRSVGQKR
ncbi:transposase [Magnetococcus sp. PR-3]|uniref:transposase n=1 Tax=Magnetococcus sp. PR-3 TaxID=3120355 RepID=UPI003FA53ACC